ncbi:type II secretion system ATPase GspE [Marinomonas atlantica]|uniref:type II secretion system ATPase GspE n=1 Tax=Marinomonas atlantica TaxID=1806668 RepID=UPI0008359652|nr:type II secretion system ATPase GspE [Marinomonas atlantica]MCO4785281.1 type II secretion system ATPase GspE [Marinomonas atlantica]
MLTLNYAFVKEHGVLLYESQSGLTLAYKATSSLAAINEALRLSPSAPNLTLLEGPDFERLVVQYYQHEGQQTLANVSAFDDHYDLESMVESIPESEDLLEREGDAPVIRLINAILSEALKDGASDIHIETYEKLLKVRFRIDGMLQDIISPKRALAPMLISRIKVMAKLDIAEKRVPQDGRILLRISGQDTDVRVSTLPSAYGERVVMRLLSKRVGQMGIEHLGMSSADQACLEQLITRPNGIVLVTGPTGSGKTTTLYSALNHLNNGHHNIMTIEDPIEYHVEGVAQTQVNLKANMTFARGLRAILRQDPDVVMVGEIRDRETADIAVQASLTGHLVLSTLHTNSAIAAITRLQDMGVESFLLSSSVVGVVAQRLVRRLCDACKISTSLDEANLTHFNCHVSPSTLYAANIQGCDQCHQGYRGRLGVYEVVPVGQELQQLIHNGVGEYELEALIRKSRPSLRQDGLDKVCQGLTSLEEVLRVTSEHSGDILNPDATSSDGH